MINPEQKLTGGVAKVEEYVGRIQSGESSEEIMKGLPDSFRTAIEAKLNPENDSEKELEEAALLAQESRQETVRMVQEDEINSANRANEIRTELGLPVQPVERASVEASDAEMLSPEEQKARDIKAGFDFMTEGLKNAGREKIKEYDERLQAALAGQPLKRGDTVANLMPDFKRLAKMDWTPDFDMTQLMIENRPETAPNIPELENVVIAENQLEARKFDTARFEFKNENGKVVESYRGMDNYRREIEGKFAEVIVGEKKLKVIFSENQSIHAGYEPSRDIYTVGPGAIEEYHKDPELFLSSLNHEIAHDNYFSLSVERQRSADDLFLDNDELRKKLYEFAAALYSDKFQIGGRTGGEAYLQIQDFHNQETINNLLSKDNSPGIKDFRSMSFELDGKQHEVFLSLLITEVISYLSSLQLGENVYQKVAENGRQRRGGQDPRYDIAADIFKLINNDTKLKTEFAKLNLFTATTERAKSDLVAMIENNI